MTRKTIFDWIEEGGPCRPSYPSSNNDTSKKRTRSDSPQRDDAKTNNWYSFRPTFHDTSEEVQDIGDYPRPSQSSPEKFKSALKTPLKTEDKKIHFEISPDFKNTSYEVRDIGDYPQTAQSSPEKLRSALRTPTKPEDKEIPSEISSNSLISPSFSQMTAPTRIMFSPSTDSEDPMDLKQSYTNTTEATEATTPTTVTIEHKLKKKDTSVAKYKKLFKPIIAIFILLVSGSAAYFFSEFLTIPGLKTQVDRLEEQNNILKNQINRLEGQIDRLEDEVDELGREIDRLGNETDRLSLINESLNQTVIEFSAQNDRLNSSLLYYEELNANLNSTVAELEDSVLNLKETVQDYSEVNDDLNQTVFLLTDEVNELDQLNHELTETNSELWTFVDRLSNETAVLSLINSELNSTVHEFQAEIVNMIDEIDRLDDLTENLATMVSFLNETSLAFDTTMDNFVSGVASQITASRIMAMGAVENFYRQRTSLWDCDFREYFLLKPFVANDRDAPIGESFFPEVLEYIQGKVLDDLCLDATNLQVYLSEYNVDSDTPSDVSFNELQRAVGLYTDLAMTYYFESDIIPPKMWAEASFKCNNLPPELTFQF